MELYYKTIQQARELLDRREVSSVELTRAVLDRIDFVEDKVGAFISITADLAMEQAERADSLLREGGGGGLCGIPFSVKDLICTRGVKTTCGSRMLENFMPPYNATVIEKLRKSGAVMVGKVSMDEFAMGSSNESCAFGTPRNPWKLDHICGGSSGGAAVSVAAGECFASLGSDTGGSIRQPASHCGVVGIKPTYGRVSRFGLVAFASSLDQVGPLTRNVYDSALVLNEISGYDQRDSTSVKEDVPDFTRALQGGLGGIKVGLPKEYFDDGLDPEVRRAVENGISAIRDAGADVTEVSLPHTQYCVATYYLIAPAEASSNLARYDGVRYGFRDKEAESLVEMYNRSRSAGFGNEVKRRIIIGTYALSSGYYDAYYKKASQVRTLISEDFKSAFEQCDVLASPVSPIPAWKIGDKCDDPLSVYLSDILTISANLAGIPGLSVPCGFSRGGLPIGLQLQGPHFQEERLLKTAFNLERQLQLDTSSPAGLL